MIVESRPVDPVGADHEDAEDEEDEDVVELVVPGPDDQAGEAEQETGSNTDINIPDSKYRLSVSDL